MIGPRPPAGGTYDTTMKRWFHFEVDESWKERAACADEDSVLFFPPLDVTSTKSRALYNQRVRDALQLCVDCPVVEECLAYAIATDTKYGIWGGTTELERARLSGRKRVY